MIPLNSLSETADRQQSIWDILDLLYIIFCVVCTFPSLLYLGDHVI